MLEKPKRIVNEEILDVYRQGQCMICDRYGVDPCHIRTRGAGGPDADFNLLKMCREHHTEQGQIGFMKMVSRYPVMILILKAKGWTMSEDGKLWHPELER